MKQTLLIGLGGTGSRVVNLIAARLRKQNTDINDGVVTCAVLDTNRADTALIEGSGTAIPVIPTSKDMYIDEYIARYAHTDIMDWCPYSTSFGRETMLAGASEMRIKSRIAFMDIIENRDILELEQEIERIFSVREDESVRVMIVTSLSGGTGSGMFIQFALWLRRFFNARNCKTNFRSVFLLPDVFIRTVESIRDNPRKVRYHYGNAYAAIRELNAINKVIEGYKPEKPIVIEGLFDSDDPARDRVFDFSFFVDDIDKRGVSFKTIGEYEALVANMVFMQLYAPMVSEMESVEDNLYRTLHAASEPLYGSCGTSKAEYPIDDVLEYCALTASKEALSEGWNKIDTEINARKEEERQAELDGIYVKNKISTRDEFIRLFDEITKKSGDQIGRAERLFLKIKKDAFNERREKTADGVVDIPTCKIAAFMEVLEGIFEKSVTANGDYKRVSKVTASLPNPDDPDNFPEDLVETLKGLRAKEETAVKTTIDKFEENIRNYADEIIRAVMPTDMGAINERNAESVYGMLVKKEPDGNTHFVHPIVARYLLYKLHQAIEKEQNRLTVEQCRAKAIAGDKTISFDNPNTRKTENREDYWEQCGLITSKAEISHFIKKYKLYNTANEVLCKQYELQLLKQNVLMKLNEYVLLLTKKAESLFAAVPSVIKEIEDSLNKNIDKNENTNGKIIYINAKEIHKKAKYESLSFDVSGYDSKLNKTVADTIYGKFCFERRPTDDDNIKYANIGIDTSLRESMVAAFTEQIRQEGYDKLHISICKAIAEESDIDNEVAGGNMYEVADVKSARHKMAIRRYVDKLEFAAVPFLRANPENCYTERGEEDPDCIVKTKEGKMFRMPIRTKLTFWGFHPMLLDEYAELEAELSANKATASSKQYGINELFCYTSEYGIKAQAVDKFNELKGGDYYTQYDTIINTMLQTGNLVDTPHIDKTWHEFLPYVSAEKEDAANREFFETLWLALAYGYLSVDDNDKFIIKRMVFNKTYNNETPEWENLICDDREISHADIKTLLEVLHSDADFERNIVPRLKSLFAEDIKDMTTYAGTKFMKGLLTNKDMNPVTLVARYAASRGSDPNFVSSLVISIEKIVKVLPENYNMKRTARSIEDATYRLCYKIYNESDRKKDKEKVFASWLEHFEDVKDIEKTEETPIE